MENLIESILWDVDGDLQGAVSDSVRRILGDDYDLIPTDLYELNVAFF